MVSLDFSSLSSEGLKLEGDDRLSQQKVEGWLLGGNRAFFNQPLVEKNQTNPLALSELREVKFHYPRVPENFQKFSADLCVACSMGLGPNNQHTQKKRTMQSRVIWEKPHWEIQAGHIFIAKVNIVLWISSLWDDVTLSLEKQFLPLSSFGQLCGNRSYWNMLSCWQGYTNYICT